MQPSTLGAVLTSVELSSSLDAVPAERLTWGGGGGVGRTRSPLSGRGGPGLLRGRLPGASLLLLMEKSIILAPVRLLCLGGWTKTIKRSSPRLILFLS